MKRIRTGIIGVGFIGAAHVEALRRLGYVDVVAIANTSNPEGKADQLHIPKGYGDYREMVDQEQLDAVHICTPNYTHFPIAMYAMERGVAVICEKPLTVTVEEAKQLRDFAKEKKIVNAVNFNLRMNPQVVQMKEMVKAGLVGDIYTVHGSYLQDWLYYDTDYNWRLDSNLSGSSRAFSDIGSHWIDMVEDITGQRAKAVFAEFATFHKTRKKPKKAIETYSGMALKPEDYEEIPIDTEDFCSVLFRFENGAIGSCNISQVYAGRKNQMIVSIAGSKCALHWDSEDSNELWVGHRETYNQKIPKDPSILHSETQKVVSYPGGHVEGFPDTMKQQFSKVYQAILEGDVSGKGFSTFEDGLREMILCDKIVESAKTGQWVSV